MRSDPAGCPAFLHASISSSSLLVVARRSRARDAGWLGRGLSGPGGGSVGDEEGADDGGAGDDGIELGVDIRASSRGVSHAPANSVQASARASASARRLRRESFLCGTGWASCQ